MSSDGSDNLRVHIYTEFSCIESQFALRTERDRDNHWSFTSLYLFVVREIISQKMSAYKIVLALTVVIAVVNAQRPFYAGLSPIGYPAAETDLISNRFGEDEDYPIVAKGDRNLINRLDAMPVDKQPFWYLNWRQYQDFRRNPQTYPQRQNSFTSGK